MKPKQPCAILRQFLEATLKICPHLFPSPLRCGGPRLVFFSAHQRLGGSIDLAPGNTNHAAPIDPASGNVGMAGPTILNGTRGQA